MRLKIVTFFHVLLLLLFLSLILITDAAGFAAHPVVSGADFRVAPVNPIHGDDPYTVQPHGCGQPGLYTHLTPEFLKNANTASRGPAGKFFVSVAYSII
jgi:hypothetical protein